jgi:hypothetical protein
MNKKFILGSTDAYIANHDIKTKVIDWLYNKLDLSKHRYNILNSIQKLEYMQKNVHYISPNFRGFNYILMMLTIDDIKYCMAIDRKKLSYHKSQLDMKTIHVFQLNVNKNVESIFKGTIFDGKLIQMKNTTNEYVFLIQDCFYLMGKKILDMDMSDKMKELDILINNNFRKENNFCKNFSFKLNKLYTYSELEELIRNLDTISIPNNGLIFFPPTSGITVLHIEKKVEKVEINSVNKEVIEQKSYHIINDFLDFLKSRTYSYETTAKMKQFLLSRTEIPDVYDIAEKEYGDKLGIALIPNLKTSQMCDNIILDEPVKFNCTYSNKFKKWIPLSPV